MDCNMLWAINQIVQSYVICHHPQTLVESCCVQGSVRGRDTQALTRTP